MPPPPLHTHITHTHLERTLKGFVLPLLAAFSRFTSVCVCVVHLCVCVCCACVCVLCVCVCVCYPLLQKTCAYNSQLSVPCLCCEVHIHSHCVVDVIVSLLPPSLVLWHDGDELLHRVVWSVACSGSAQLFDVGPSSRVAH